MQTATVYNYSYLADAALYLILYFDWPIVVAVRHPSQRCMFNAKKQTKNLTIHNNRNNKDRDVYIESNTNKINKSQRAREGKHDAACILRFI